jgi:hypothetical protein
MADQYVDLFDEVISPLREAGEKLGKGYAMGSLDISHFIFKYPDQTVRQLAIGAKTGSHGTLTIRQVDPRCMEEKRDGEVLYMVICPADTPQGLVTELPTASRLIAFMAHTR